MRRVLALRSKEEPMSALDLSERSQTAYWLCWAARRLGRLESAPARTCPTAM